MISLNTPLSPVKFAGTGPDGKIRVVLCKKHYEDSLVLLQRTLSDQIEMVGGCDTAEDLPALIAEKHPDVVLGDYRSTEEKQPNVVLGDYRTIPSAFQRVAAYIKQVAEQGKPIVAPGFVLWSATPKLIDALKEMVDTTYVKKSAFVFHSFSSHDLKHLKKAIQNVDPFPAKVDT